MKELSEIAKHILEERYLIKDEQGNVIETPEEMFRRVAKTIAQADTKYGDFDVKETEETFFKMMSNLDMIPNTPCLANAGKNDMGFAACYTLDILDSMEGIFDTLKDASIIQQSGGGVGYNFSSLRPENDIVKSTVSVSSGPISFMKVYNAATEQIKQANMRRGANMAILNCDHPSIEDFIKCKDQEGELRNFNISVAITDKFMKALENNEEYELINPRNQLPVKKIKAKKVWDSIIKHSYLNGEPGLFFIDTTNKVYPCKHLGYLTTTNPCCSGDTLVAVPTKIVDDIVKEFKEVRADSLKVGDEIVVQDCINKVPRKIQSAEVHLEKDIFIVKTIRGKDIKVTAAHQFLAKKMFPNDEYVIGWYMLKELNILDKLFIVSNDHDEIEEEEIVSIEHCGTDTVYDYYVGKLDNWITNCYISKGCGELALEKNTACTIGSINLFNFTTDKTIQWGRLKETVHNTVHFLDNVIDVNNYPLSKIEQATKKTRRIGLGIMGFHDVLIKHHIKYDSEKSISYAEKIMRFINDEAFKASVNLAKTRGPFPAVKGSSYDQPFMDKPRNATRTTIAPTGTVSQIANVSSGIEPNFNYEYERLIFDKPISIKHWAKDDETVPKEVLVTSSDIPPEYHIRVQAAFQKYVDSSISKTVILPFNAKEKDVSDAFLLAYKLGCKGCTVYRDNSRSKQVIYNKEACPVCGADIVREEKCKKCSKCTWTACNI